MPTYEYQCDACQHNFDEFQSFSDKPLKKCPKCRKPKLRRVFGAGAAVIFKGSGFYQTDYRSDSYHSAAKADQEGGKAGTTDKTATNGTAGAVKESGTANGTGGKESAGGKGKSSKSKSPASDD
jgi:putative FmdB family regulatory protein